MQDSVDLYGCTECGHRATDDEMDGRAVFEDCHECGAGGNNRGYYRVWSCPNCQREYIGCRPTAYAGGVEGCNRCFISVPENHLRDAVESGDASKLEKFVPDRE